MSDVGYLAALVAGTLSLLSPCSALLLPSFFAYAFASTHALLARTAVFYLGLCLTLVPLGSGVGAVSSLFLGHRGTVVAVAGWLVVAMGLLQLLGRGFTLPFVDRLRDAEASRRGSGWVSTLLLGAVYGLAGFCAGPVLGAILTVAAVSGSPWRGGSLLAVYALGMAVPLFLLAALWDRFDLGRRSWLRPRPRRVGPLTLHPVSVVSGLLFIGIGVLFLRYDGTAGLVGRLGVPDLSDVELSAQEAVTDAAAAVPDWVLPAVVLVVALVVAVRRVRDEGHREPPDRPD